MKCIDTRLLGNTELVKTLLKSKNNLFLSSTVQYTTVRYINNCCGVIGISFFNHALVLKGPPHQSRFA